MHVKPWRELQHKKDLPAQGVRGYWLDGQVIRETASGETYKLILTDAEQRWFFQNTGKRWGG